MTNIAPSSLYDHRVSWFDLSANLYPGDRVQFVEPFPQPRFPGDMVPVGTNATVIENGLNEIFCTLLLLPDATEGDTRDDDERAIFMGGHLNPGADTEDEPESEESQEWFAKSPLVVRHALGERKLHITVDDDDNANVLTVTCTVREFFRDNDGFAPSEIVAISAALVAGEEYVGGGGAAPIWRARLLPATR